MREALLIGRGETESFRFSEQQHAGWLMDHSRLSLQIHYTFSKVDCSENHPVTDRKYWVLDDDVFHVIVKEERELK